MHAQTESNEFQATHEITVTYAGGLTTTVQVMLLDGAGYTESEWELAENADWTFDETDGWLCQGQATPAGANGTVKVRKLSAHGNAPL